MSAGIDAKRVEDLFPARVVAEADAPQLLLGELFEEERAQIARAVDKRKAEYATARVLARRAMERLSLPRGPLVNDEARCPRWPEGVVGSISHTQGACAVVLAPRSEAAGIGLDIEVATPIRDALHDKICTERELAWLGERPDEERRRMVRLLFSAKEAFYKAQYLVSRTYLGFHQAEMVALPKEGTFELILKTAAGPLAEGQRFAGRYAEDGGFFVTAVLHRDA